jgi:hypothetical protein
LILDFKYFLFRYLSYTFIALEVIIVPLYLSKERYGELELLKSIAALGPYSLLGAFSGYIYDRYSLKNDSYDHFFFWGAISGLVGGVLFSIWYGQILIFIPFLLNALSIVQEKKLQVSGYFFLSILFKPILSFTIVIVMVLFDHSGVVDNSILSVLLISYVVSYVSWTVLCINKSRMRLVVLSLGDLRKSLRIYSGLVRKGFIINLSTIILSLFLFNFRSFINEYFTNDLASFSLAFNFAQFVFLGVNTVGYVLTVQIGEQLDSLDRIFLLKILKKSFLLFIFLFLSGLLSIFLYDKYVKSFDNVLVFYIILCTLIGVYYVASVISPILLYKDTIKESTILFFFIFVLDYALTEILIQAELGVVMILLKSGFLLVLSAIYNLYLIFYRSNIGR